MRDLISTETEAHLSSIKFLFECWQLDIDLSVDLVQSNVDDMITNALRQTFVFF